jgi:hypothetical protein
VLMCILLLTFQSNILMPVSITCNSIL